MAKLVSCRICCIEVGRIELADGSVTMICAACETIGVAHEVVRGGRMWTDRHPKPGAPQPASRRRGSRGANANG